MGTPSLTFHGKLNVLMRLNEAAEPEDDAFPVPTVEGERHFMAQCEYVNSLTSAAGRHARKLLRAIGAGTQCSG